MSQVNNIKMSSQLSINISKILNWNPDKQNHKMEIAFYGVSSGSYISHKTVVGYSISQALVLNTSFKIVYNYNEHLVNCKITNLTGRTGSEIVGTIEIDLQLLAQRSLLFLPFEDHDKVLEVKVYEPNQETNSNHSNELKDQRQCFLQQRYQFLDQLAHHQANLKKKFSERVYSFLKELKNRNVSQGFADRESTTTKNETVKNNKYRHQIDFRSRLNDQRKRIEFRNQDLFSHPDSNHLRVSPPKGKAEQQLMINSYRQKSSKTQKDQNEVNEFMTAREQRAEKEVFGGMLKMQSIQRND